MDPTDSTAILTFRIDSIEKHLSQIESQMAGLVPQRENDLRIQSIKDIVGDVRTDVSTMKNTDLVAINRHISDVEKQISVQGESQRENLDKFQIRSLTIVASSVLTIVIAFIVNYFTHFIR